MSDIEKAKSLLAEGNFTCVLCKGEDIITSTERGVKPLVARLASASDFDGFSAADKVIGRATAFLYVLLGVRCVYASVLSRAAASVLSAFDIDFHYDTLTDNIINRQGDDICPFERAVLDICDAETAYKKILQKMDEMNISI